MKEEYEVLYRTRLLITLKNTFIKKNRSTHNQKDYECAKMINIEDLPFFGEKTVENIKANGLDKFLDGVLDIR
jgi:hypothetical protein